MVMERCKGSFGEFRTCGRKSPMRVAEALQNVVSNARQEGRLVAGITQIAAIMKRYTRSFVMMCIVEINSMENMQMKLLEAFCTEHEIKVIKVDDCSKLLKTHKEVDQKTASADTNCDLEFRASVSEQTTKNCGCKQAPDFCRMDGECTLDGESDTTCLLLTQSAHLTDEEEFVLSFYNTFRDFVSDQYPLLKMETPL